MNFCQHVGPSLQSGPATLAWLPSRDSNGQTCLPHLEPQYIPSLHISPSSASSKKTNPTQPEFLWKQGPSQGLSTSLCCHTLRDSTGVLTLHLYDPPRQCRPINSFCPALGRAFWNEILAMWLVGRGALRYVSADGTSPGRSSQFCLSFPRSNSTVYHTRSPRSGKE